LLVIVSLVVPHLKAKKMPGTLPGGGKHASFQSANLRKFILQAAHAACVTIVLAGNTYNIRYFLRKSQAEFLREYGVFPKFSCLRTENVLRDKKEK